MNTYELVVSWDATGDYVPFDFGEVSAPPINGVVGVSSWVHQGIERTEPLKEYQWKALILAAQLHYEIHRWGPFMIEETQSVIPFNLHPTKWAWLRNLPIIGRFFRTRSQQLRFWERL